MTSKSRGRTDAELTRGGMSETAALSSQGESAVIVEPSEKVAPVEMNPLRDGRTFAPPSAPWVGAERAWRHGIVPPPHEQWSEYDTYIEEERPTLPHREPLLSDEEIAAVLSTMPPAPTADAVPKREHPASQLLKYAAVAAFTAVTAWAVFGGMERPTGAHSDPPPQILRAAALPAAELRPAEAQRAAPLSPTENTATELSKDGTTVELSEIASAEPIVAEETATSVRPQKRRAKTSRAVVATEETESAAPSIETSEPQAESESAPTSPFDVSNPYVAADSPAPAEPSAPPPVDLSRGEVRRVMSGVAPHVARCAGNRTGQIVMEVWISGATGRVTDAIVTDKTYAGTATGLCAAKAVRLAKFRKFPMSSLTITYPFDL